MFRLTDQGEDLKTRDDVHDLLERRLIPICKDIGSGSSIYYLLAEFNPSQVYKDINKVCAIRKWMDDIEKAAQDFDSNYIVKIATLSDASMAQIVLFVMAYPRTKCQMPRN